MENELENAVVSEMERIYRYMYRLCRNEYSAEDLTQETVLEAYRAYPLLREKAKIVPWLWGIAHYVYARSLRPKHDIPTDINDADIITISSFGAEFIQQSVEDEYIKKTECEKIRRAVSYLAKNYREVCVMYWLEEKDYNAIAKELNIPLSSVKWRLNQAKNQLKKEYEKMDYMEKGYRKAVDLKITAAGYTSHGENLDKINEVIKSLLAKNICLSAYHKHKTVTEISSEIGVSADYVEYELSRLIEIGAVKQISDKYATMFPIWNKTENADIWGGLYDLALEKADEIIDMTISSMNEIKNIGFIGSERESEKLLLFTLGYICENTPNKSFPTDLLPFSETNIGWFIMATDEKYYEQRGTGSGISSCVMNDCAEYCFCSDLIDDQTDINSSEIEIIKKLCRGEADIDEYWLAKLVEEGKVVKKDKKYMVNVPLIDERKGEVTRLNEILSPVLNFTGAIQEKLIEYSREAVRRNIPKRIEVQNEFFGRYCALNVLENVISEALSRRKIKLTADMASWFILR